MPASWSGLSGERKEVHSTELTEAAAGCNTRSQLCFRVDLEEQAVLVFYMQKMLSVSSRLSQCFKKKTKIDECKYNEMSDCVRLLEV